LNIFLFSESQSLRARVAELEAEVHLVSSSGSDDDVALLRAKCQELEARCHEEQLINKRLISKKRKELEEIQQVRFLRWFFFQTSAHFPAHFLESFVGSLDCLHVLTFFV
jgi:bifunctional ADP-heptose synthase (sugar kinase/adenylyltransferase)